MVSLANRESEARRARRFSSTSLRTYTARTILPPPWRERIKNPREALHGENNPSSSTPESKNNLATAGLWLAIQALEPTLTDPRQVLQRLLKRNATFCQRLLQASAEPVQGCLGRSHADVNRSSRFSFLFFSFDFRLCSEHFHRISPFTGPHGAERSTACQASGMKSGRVREGKANLLEMG